METVRAAADMFSHHAAPQNSGCGLQAKFLQNVVRVFRKAQELRPGRSTQHPNQQGPGRCEQDERNRDEVVATSGSNGDALNSINETGSTFSLPETLGHDISLGEYDNTFGIQDFAFADDNIWASLFADAGFNINEGVFLPYGEGEFDNMDLSIGHES